MKRVACFEYLLCFVVLQSGWKLACMKLSNKDTITPVVSVAGSSSC